MIDNKNIYLSLMLSVLLHMFFIGVLPSIQKQDLNKNTFDPIMLESINIEKMLPGKIVDLINNDISKDEPKKAEYFSDTNRQVSIETKAANSTSKPSTLTQNSKISKPESIAKEQDEEEFTLNIEKNKTLYPSQEILSKINIPYDPNQVDAQLGDETRLNTKTFLYSSFFTRVKRQIATNWQPQDAFSQIQRINQSNPPSLVVTKVSIYLNKRGELLSVYIIKSSGYVAWDQEALKAVRKASPFRNPPPGIFNEYGAINFEFSFIGEITRSIFQRSIE
ncbi:MAG: energy transducer TonB [Pseudomonadota bacterium]